MWRKFDGHDTTDEHERWVEESDQDVRMISSEAPIVFALACQMFITEITHKAAYYARKHNRKTLQRNDIARVIADNE